MLGPTGPFHLGGGAPNIVKDGTPARGAVIGLPHHQRARDLYVRDGAPRRNLRRLQPVADRLILVAGSPARIFPLSS